MKNKPSKAAMDLAKEIALALFTNAGGLIAKRLVMELDKLCPAPSEIVGWEFLNAQIQIAQAITKYYTDQKS